jgi:lambda family phage tail tape measure protein
MADLAKLAVEVTGKGIAQVKRGLDQLGNSAKKTESAAGKLTSEFVNMKTAAGALVGALAVREVAMVGSAFVQAASEAAETQNKFSVVFSSIQEDAEKTAQTLQYAYGMSNQAAKESLSAVGDLLTGLGVQQDTALSLAEQTVQLGTDLASFTNYAGGATGATEALTKAMLGETEQAKSLGLVLLETPTKAYAESLGLVWENLTLAEKAQVRLNFAMTQSPNAIGDFARSSAELANQLRIADGVTADMRENVGKGLLPAVKEVVTAFTSSREGLEDFSTVVGSVFAESLTGANGLLKSFTDEAGRLKTTGLSALFVQAAGAVKLFASGLDVAWISIKQGLEDIKSLATFDFWGEDATESTNKFATALIQASDNANLALDMLKNPIDFVKVALFDAEEQAEKTGKAVSKALAPSSGGTTSGGATQVKGYEKAVQDLQDRLFELTHTAEENEKYQINQWYNSKAALIGYTAELERARQLELAAVDTKSKEKDAQKQAQIQAEINRAMLANEQASAYQRVEIIKAEYGSKIAAAERYGLSTAGLEAERSLKIQAIWDAEEQKHGSMVDGFISGLDKYGESASTNFERAETAGLTMARSLESGLSTFFDVTGKGWEDWGSTAMNVVNDVLNAVVQASIVSPLAGAFSSGLSSLAGSLFSSGPSLADMAANPAMTFQPRAKGAAFQGGSISAYSGSIVSSPTFFMGNDIKAYAKGGNVMGEAGPEAILPLTRTSGGKLGVQAVNGQSSGDIKVNIYNEGSPVEAESRQQSDGRGGISIDVFLKPVKEAIARDIATNGSMLNSATKTAVGVNNGTRPGMGRGF